MSSVYYYEKKLNNLVKYKNNKIAEVENIIKKHGGNLLFDDVLNRKVKYVKSGKFRMNCDLNIIELIHEIESNGFKVTFDKNNDAYVVTRKEIETC